MIGGYFNMRKLFGLFAMIFVLSLGIGITTHADEWKRDTNGWWYVYSNGTYPTAQWLLINGRWYYFEDDGYMATNRWKNNYYLGKDGAMLVSTTTPDGYKVDGSGRRINAQYR